MLSTTIVFCKLYPNLIVIQHQCCNTEQTIWIWIVAKNDISYIAFILSTTFDSDPFRNMQ